MLYIKDIPELIEFCSDKTDEELSHLPRAGFMIPKLALMTAVFRVIKLVFIFFLFLKNSIKKQRYLLKIFS